MLNQYLTCLINLEFSFSLFTLVDGVQVIMAENEMFSNLGEILIILNEFF